MKGLLAAMILAAQPAPAPDDAEALMADVLAETGVPAAALIVVGPDGPIVQETEGLRAAGGEAPVRPGDAWHIGSNAKAMTATLALVLAQDSVIDLDDTVTEVLGEAYRVHEDWSAVTLRSLLGHRGGVQPNAGRLTMARGILLGAKTEAAAPKDRRRVLKGLLKKPPQGEVGAYDYSNLGYTLAGEMLQAAAGEPFEALIRARLFAPLGMEGVVFGAPQAPGGAISGHWGEAPDWEPADIDNPLFMSPAGTLAFPPDAYAAFLTDQLRGQMGLDALLPTEAYEAMASAPEGGTYGLGWGVREDGTLGHSGSNTAWMATAILAPQEGRAAAVIVNAGKVPPLAPFAEAALALGAD